MSHRAGSTSAGFSGRRALSWVLKIGVSAGLLYILFARIDIGKLWELLRRASLGWIAVALGIYFVMMLVATWRWRTLLAAQQVDIRFGTLLNSYLAATFANNFLPSNIGGDVIRIGDTARASGSKTLAASVVLADRFVGVLGLAFVAASGSALAAQRSEAIGGLFWGSLLAAVAASGLALARPEWIGLLARPLRVFHAEWVDRRIATVMGALHRFRRAPGALAIGFLASIGVQGLLVLFYASIAAGLRQSVPLGHMAILVPLSSLVQMAPVSLNGHGVRETTFVGYLTRLGVARESAFAVSILGGALVVLFSMTGAAAYLARRHDPAVRNGA